MFYPKITKNIKFYIPENLTCGNFVIADACLKSALSLIPDLPPAVEIDGKMRSSESFLVSFICHLLSTLLIVPVILFNINFSLYEMIILYLIIIKNKNNVIMFTSSRFTN